MTRRLLITTSADQTAKIWRTSDFSLLQELKQQNQRWVWDAAFSADSQYVFTGKYAFCLPIAILKFCPYFSFIRLYR